METFLIRALQLIMSLSLLIIIHEGGHFFFSRIFHVRVEKFYIFFDPWFSLFKFKSKRSETEYGIGWLPLGGYVKIAGMIDESMDTEQMKRPPQPWEFRSKPAWQRLIIMVAGVVFNFLLALFIYSMILFAWGDQYVDVQKAPMGMAFNETAKSVGFKDGDVLLSADGEQFVRYGGDLLSKIVDSREVTVKRGDKTVAVYIPDKFMEKLMTDSIRFASYRFPFVADTVAAHTPAAMAGIQCGDSIVALNGKPISFIDFKKEMDNCQKLAAKPHSDSINYHRITLTYIRKGQSHTVTLNTDAHFKIGIVPVQDLTKLMPCVDLRYGFFESFPAGIKLGVRTLSGYVNSMKYVFSKEGAKQLGGFGTIGSIFPATWDWHQFWYMTAFLSIILAFMNILPIPALDGGHVLFLIYEIVTRRKPSDKFLEYAQMVGMGLLLLLLIWANFNDILRFFF
jgi:regulator of sigma E protease